MTAGSVSAGSAVFGAWLGGCGGCGSEASPAPGPFDGVDWRGASLGPRSPAVRRRAAAAGRALGPSPFGRLSVPRERAARPQRLILDGTPLCRGPRFQLPPFQDTKWYTQACFIEASSRSRWYNTWPETGCEPPCVWERRDCSAPLGSSIEAAKERFQVWIPPARWFADPQTDPSRWPVVVAGTEVSVAPIAVRAGTLDLFRPAVVDMYELVNAALALIRENLDIVEWLLCLVDEWGALAPPHWVPGWPQYEENGPRYNTGELFDSMMAGLDGAYAVYLIERYGLDSTGRREDATGSASEPDRGYFAAQVAADGFPFGVVLPVGNRYWRKLRRSYLGKDDPERLCATLVAAEIILHEMMHIAVEGEVEPSNCWQLQHMLANSWQWAMGERFPCLRNNPCCPRVDPAFFMNAEPKVVQTRYRRFQTVDVADFSTATIEPDRSVDAVVVGSLTIARDAYEVNLLANPSPFAC